MNVIQQLLFDAKSALTPETWGKGHEINCNRKLCAATALRQAHINRGDNLYLIHSWPPLLHAIGLDRAVQISDWNDAPERTLLDVHSAFDRAIELAATAPSAEEGDAAS